MMGGFQEWSEKYGEYQESLLIEGVYKMLSEYFPGVTLDQVERAYEVDDELVKDLLHALMGHLYC